MPKETHCRCGEPYDLRRRRRKDGTDTLGRDCPACRTERTKAWRVRSRLAYLASRRATYMRTKRRSA